MKKLLIITSSGGGGLLQAANAKEQEIQLKHPHVQIVRKDIMKDWVWKWMGAFAITMWNTAQKRGNVAALKVFCGGSGFISYCFGPHVFFQTLYTVWKEDIDHIIDTQPISTYFIVKALRFFHWRKGKKVTLEKVIVDFPTKKATHFFKPIRKLSDIDRSYVKVTTIPPFLEEGETREEFWKKNCRLPESQVKYEPFFVRQSFCKFHGLPKSIDPLKVKAKIKNWEEQLLIQQSLKKGCLENSWNEQDLEFSIGASDRVFTILLGSQPAHEGSINYVKRFIELAKKYEDSKTASHLFVFCSNHRVSEQSLLKKVSDLVTQTKDYPKGFSVVPLSFQGDEVIAPLFYRSNSTCTRSGGQTLMELMCVSPKEIWIHSECKKKGKLSDEDLLSGIAGWESASAVYMQKMYGAKIVTPETFGVHASRIFEKTIHATE